jgi:micrococcal nuclease
MKILFLALVGLFLSGSLWAQENEAVKVYSIDDPNHLIVIARNGQKIKISWWGIDCPSYAQPQGSEVYQYLRHHVKGKKVQLEILGRNAKGVLLVKISLADGRVVNEELLRLGLAWAAERTSHNPYLELQEQAHAAGIGLWQEETPISPWAFRRQESLRAPKGR